MVDYFTGGSSDDDEEEDDDSRSLIEILEDMTTDLRRTIAYGALQLNANARNALETLKGTKDSMPARQAMRIFFGGVTENDFQFNNPIQGDLADAIESIGVPGEIADVVSYIAYVHPLLTIVGGIGDAVKDDAGLHNTVEAAQSLFNSVDATPTGDLTPSPSSGGASNLPPSVADFTSIAEVADAYVELERLICHIRCNYDYYKQALWISKGADYRSEFLAKSKVSHLVRNEVIGFYGKYVAFPLINVSIFAKRLDIPKLIKLLNSNIPAAVSDLVTIPTSSTILEGKLGDCDLCEDYIDQSRLADVRQQNAKAALDEAEANYKNSRTAVSDMEALRRQERIAAGDLSDPIGHSNANLDINLTTNSDAP